mmetsp:Transcript_39520/g.47954  ORF Transcript_39520/g.47954 Transcript_39520/m.47954 type:complete len:346 (-) Transcript_39520:958-1995(-)
MCDVVTILHPLSKQHQMVQALRDLLQIRTNSTCRVTVLRRHPRVRSVTQPIPIQRIWYSLQLEASQHSLRKQLPILQGISEILWETAHRDVHLLFDHRVRVSVHVLEHPHRGCSSKGDPSTGGHAVGGRWVVAVEIVIAAGQDVRPGVVGNIHKGGDFMKLRVVVVVHEHQPLALREGCSVITSRSWASVLLSAILPSLGGKLQDQLLLISKSLRSLGAVIDDHNLHIGILLLLYTLDRLLQQRRIVISTNTHRHQRPLVVLQCRCTIELLRIEHYHVMPYHPRLVRVIRHQRSRRPQPIPQNLLEPLGERLGSERVDEDALMIIRVYHLRHPPHLGCDEWNAGN